jgi:Protein of unknown function (DUF3575).
MKQLIFIFLTFFSTGGILAQNIAIKNNILYDATATPNLGIEVGLSKHLSFDVSGGCHPWSFNEDKSLKHWLVQPELRYWFSERFSEHYMGLHAQYMDYDFQGFNLPWGMKKGKRYDGTSWGFGLSYGYQLYLTPRWNMEFTLGGGYCQFEYTKYEPNQNGEKVDTGEFKRNYYGITKLGISIVYIIK